MRILASAGFDEVLARFRAEHSCDSAHEANTNSDAEAHLFRAQELFGHWQRVMLTREDVRSIVLPWHLSEGGATALVPKTGLTVADAVAELEPIAARYAGDSPVCWAKIERMRTAPPSPVFLSAPAIDGRDYDGLATKDGLTHLDGLHRLLSWELHGVLAGGAEVEAYVAVAHPDPDPHPAPDPDAADATRGRICVVTGAGSGIGRACSLALARAGWTVVLAGRRRAPLDQTAELIAAAGGSALAVSADIASRQSVEQLFATVGERFGRLDLLFNNAGANMPYTPVDEIPYDDWVRVLHTTVTGTFLCAQHAFRMMKAQAPQGGRIINNGAPSAHVPRPGALAYTAARHAVLGITRGLSLDGRPYGIACGQIDLGNVTPVGREQPPSPQADGSMEVEPTMDMRCVTDTVMLMASLPLHANIQSVTVLPTTMPYIGRG